jgi:hypothetical protein
MTVVATKNFPPPPIRDPLLGMDGGPAGITLSWTKWFQTISTQLISQLEAIAASAIADFTQANLPTNLTVNQKGYLISVSDYAHILRWTGSAWTWGPGDPGSGYIAPFLSAPTQLGWHLCDGSMVKRLNADGTLTSVVLPNYTTAAYLKLGTILAMGPNAPSGLTNAVSGGTPSGTNSIPNFTGTPATTSVESADTANVAVTGATSVAAAGHTHTITPAGTVSAPAFTGAALPPHAHGPGTLDLLNTQLQAWYRQ